MSKRRGSVATLENRNILADSGNQPSWPKTEVLCNSYKLTGVPSILSCQETCGEYLSCVISSSMLRSRSITCSLLRKLKMETKPRMFPSRSWFLVGWMSWKVQGAPFPLIWKQLKFFFIISTGCTKEIPFFIRIYWRTEFCLVHPVLFLLEI